MRNPRSLILFFFMPSFLLASPIDTISSITVTRGVVHSKLSMLGPYLINLLDVDLNDPFVRIESYRPRGLVKTTKQVEANDDQSHRVVGAVNADFFGFETGKPIGNQVVNGKVVLGIPSNHSQLAISSNAKAMIDTFTFSGTLTNRFISSIPIKSVNSFEDSIGVFFFNSYYDRYLKRIPGSSLFVLKKITEHWLLSIPISFIVLSSPSSDSVEIPEDGGVLVTRLIPESTSTSLPIEIRDTLTLTFGFLPKTEPFIQLISGIGRLLRDGENLPLRSPNNEGMTARFTEVRHPRTFVGISSNGTHLFLCTVDGRQASSKGMTFFEMADFLKNIGAREAFNLDGGGSTTMVVRHETVNSPSDASGERPVANTLQIVSIAPPGSLDTLAVRPRPATLFQNQKVQFIVDGFDEFKNPLPIPSHAQWSCSKEIGTITSEGLFTAVQKPATGWLFVSFGALKDSMPITVLRLVDFRMNPSALLVPVNQNIPYSLLGRDERGIWHHLQSSLATYRSSSSIVIDTAFITCQKANYAGFIEIQIDKLKKKFPVISRSVDSTVIIEDFSDNALWEWDVQGTDPDHLQFEIVRDRSSSFLKISYQSLQTGAVAILKTGLRLTRQPESISVLMRHGDALNGARMIARGIDGRVISVSADSLTRSTGAVDTIRFRIPDSKKPIPGGQSIFALIQIQLRLRGTTAPYPLGDGSLLVDDIVATFSKSE